MAPEKNLSLIFKKTPSGFPVAGEHLTVEEREYDPWSDPPSGGLIVRNLFASFDPYLRGKMRDPGTESYTPAFTLNEPIVTHCVSRVLKSDDSKFKEGDTIVTPGVSVQQYATLSKDLTKGAIKIEPSSPIKDLRHFLGALGMPGLTAYSSVYEIGKPKKGETIFISSAAGAVGQIVGQLAKHEGLTVIGSVGSDEKLKYITEELKFDGGFNYKKEKPLDALKRLAPDGIDIYYENVGGEHLEAALEMLKSFGRIVGCGMISQYNLPRKEMYGIKNLFYITAKNLTFQGFIVSAIGSKWSEEHQERVSQWIADGSFQAKIAETDGIEQGPEGFVGMLRGDNFGKAVLKI